MDFWKEFWNLRSAGVVVVGEEVKGRKKGNFEGVLL